MGERVEGVRTDAERLHWMLTVCAKFDGQAGRMLPPAEWESSGGVWDTRVWLEYGPRENPFSPMYRTRHEFHVGATKSGDSLDAFRRAIDMAMEAAEPEPDAPEVVT